MLYMIEMYSMKMSKSQFCRNGINELNAIHKKLFEKQFCSFFLRLMINTKKYMILIETHTKEKHKEREKLL